MKLHSLITHTIITTFVINSAFAPVVLAADKDDQCNATCTAFRDATSGDALAAACGDPSKPIERIRNNKKTYTSYESCVQDISGDWQVLSDHCNAYLLYDDGKTAELVTAIAYTVAAAACWAACGTNNAYVIAACYVTGIGSALTDIGFTMGLLGDDKPYNQWYGQLGSAIGGFAALGQATQVYEKVTEKTVEKAGEKTNYCITAGMYSVAATLKQINYITNLYNSSKECSIISEHPLPSSVTIKYGELASTDGSTVSTGSSGTSLKGSSGSNKKPSSNSKLPDTMDFSDPTNPYVKAALAGPLGEIVQNMPHRDRLAEDAEKALGKSVSEIRNALASGTSPTSLLGNMNGAPSGFGEKMAELEQLIKDGKIQMNGIGGVVGTSYKNTGSGKGGATAKGQPAKTGFGFFGSKAPGSSTARSAQFDKIAPKQLISANGDIWHEDWNGTIFQIVSGKLVKTNDRIEKLEWDTPLNRALMGLPAKKSNRFGGGK